jgi:hypothetical protein
MDLYNPGVDALIPYCKSQYEWKNTKSYESFVLLSLESVGFCDSFALLGLNGNLGQWLG